MTDFRAVVINTASDINEVILIGNGKVKSEKALGKFRTSEILLPTIDSLLTKEGLSLSDLDYVGVVVGPGSFTGIRIGVSTVRAIAYTLGKKCVPVTYFDVLAYKVCERTDDYAVMANAGAGICYFSYRGEYKVLKTSDAVEFCRKNDITVITDDKELSGCKAIFSQGDLYGAFLARLENPCGYDELIPLYIRKSQAERGEGEL